MDVLGLYTANSLNIHPIWPIDEYATTVRIWLWFIPINPPTKALIPAIVKIKYIFFWGKMNARIDKGANFCHVDRIRHDIHEIDAITDGYQKWHGTLPSFSSTAMVNISGIRLGREEYGIHIEVLAISKRADPKAWAKKYFTDPSVSWLFFVCNMIGINLRRFSSIAPHNKIQFVLDNAISVLSIKDANVSIMIGERIIFIKLRRRWAPL